MSRTTPADLLTRLLHLHWRGGVDQGEAAKLLGIRKEEFAELAALKRCLLIVERAVWTYYMAQFNYCFPECDRRAVMRPRHIEPMCGERRYLYNIGQQALGGSRMYSDAELMAPPKRELENGRPA